MPELPWRRQVTPVIPLAPKAAAPSTKTIDRHRDAGGEPLHSSREGKAIVGLGEQMKMIVQNGILEHTKSLRRRARDLRQHELRNDFGAQVGRLTDRSHRHQRRRVPVERWPAPMWLQPDVFRPRLPSRPDAAPTPGAKLEGCLHRLASCKFECAKPNYAYDECKSMGVNSCAHRCGCCATGPGRRRGFGGPFCQRRRFTAEYKRRAVNPIGVGTSARALSDARNRASIAALRAIDGVDIRADDPHRSVAPDDTGKRDRVTYAGGVSRTGEGGWVIVDVDRVERDLSVLEAALERSTRAAPLRAVDRDRCGRE